ncbi:hypothetical protein GDO86_007669 [Hymenochirus boettgeri]|nr:hypothetical protein GDO86_007669 [Hymenochirus boettgeri]
MMCYSDFPMPANFPVYLQSSKVLEYLRIYTEHFHLLKYIRFQSEVCSVTRNSSYSSTGQWDVRIKTTEDTKDMVFDAVLVCSGLYVQNHLPLDSFPGIQSFKGHYSHSRFYKNSCNYLDKTVLVVGNGNSAADIAVEISSKAKQVYLSIRSGSWVLSRIAHCGFPVDMVKVTRFSFWIQNLLPDYFAARKYKKQINSWFNHENYGFLPLDRTELKEPVVNDNLPSSILCGAIKLKPQIRAFTENTVVFEDNTVVENLDEVIFATGYTTSFPFIKDHLIQLDDMNSHLYKQVFSTRIEKPTLAFLALVRPLGAIMPVSELQARWATRIFKGVAHLPSVDQMENYISKKTKLKTKCFSKHKVPKMLFLEYMDEIAVEIGVRPKVSQLLFKDPHLAWQIFFGPSTPYQYRLTGPGNWTGAKKAILTQWERTISPTRIRTVCRPPNYCLNITTVLSIFVLLLSICCLAYIM